VFLDVEFPVGEIDFQQFDLTGLHNNFPDSSPSCGQNHLYGPDCEQDREIEGDGHPGRNSDAHQMARFPSLMNIIL
jgi:hypothetical protein